MSRHRRPHDAPRAPRRCSTAPAIQRAPPELLRKTDNPREGWENGTPPPHRELVCVFLTSCLLCIIFYQIARSEQLAPLWCSLST